jgi:DNA-binding NtrC family response regulator
MNESIEQRLEALIRDLQRSGLALEEAKETFERKYVAIALSGAGGNVTRAARAIGVHRNTLHNKKRRQSVWR